MASPSYLRDPGSIRLLVEFGLGNGLAAPQLLARSGLKEEQLDDPLVEVEPEQELRVIMNLVNLLGIPSSLNFAVMGSVILIGVLADQQFSRHRNRARDPTARRRGRSFIAIIAVIAIFRIGATLVRRRRAGEHRRAP